MLRTFTPSDVEWGRTARQALRRTTGLVCALLVAVLAWGSSLSVPVEAQAADAWAMQGHDSRRTGRTTLEGPERPVIKWVMDLGSTVQDNTGPIVGPDGSIYIRIGGQLKAINTDGTVRWQIPSSLPPTCSCAPALSPTGDTIYHPFAEFPPFPPGGSLVTGIRALATSDGHEHWRLPLPLGGMTYSSHAVGFDGTLYFGTWGSSKIVAINPNGTLRWTYDSGSGCAQESPVAVDTNGYVYFEHNCIGLIALDQNGVERWRRGGSFTWRTPTIAADGTVYIDGLVSGTLPVRTETIGFRPDGSVKWRRDSGAAGYFKGFALSASGSTLFSFEAGKLLALNTADGASQWSRTLAPAQQTFTGSPALTANNVLYVMGDYFSPSYTPDSVFAVSAVDGHLVWSMQFDSELVFWGAPSPAIGPGRTLYVVSSGCTTIACSPLRNGKLYAIGESPALAGVPVPHGRALVADPGVVFPGPTHHPGGSLQTPPTVHPGRRQ
ncbi:MAG: PQQ-binding-like beta-propeller repeat protein [Chloroflexota bacterium]